MTSPVETRSKITQQNIAKLKEKLRELFQLDRGDLDFGLYRIMALKSAEVSDFLEKDLLPQVTEALGAIAQSDQTVLNAELERFEKNLKEVGIASEKAPKVQEVKAQIKSAKSDQQTEADTYNHLCNFFARYYDEGDFMSLRRYKGAGNEAYSIPYNGEEVKLHWANADQYYIKTTENYASYIFTLGAKSAQRVRFEIAGADNEKDNIKETNGKQRFFVLAKKFISEDENKLIIRFDHRPLNDGEKIKYPQNGSTRQSMINQDSEQRIFKKMETHWSNMLAVRCPTEKEESRTLLGKHITTYTAKNSFDYFIHKNLGDFLRRELDNYLKSEVISIDNLELTDDPVVFIRNLAQIKAIKIVGTKIIDFLAQLENFQKQLWLKKKFILATQYCVTLDKVPQSLYAEIANNKAQHDEWVKLFAIDEINGDIVSSAYSKKLKPEFLTDHPYLVIDTRHFDQTFTDKLLAALSEKESIDKQLNGLLIHGENFQALNLLQERYKEQVQCIYIDPPYNTDASAILYKNGYKDSSWLSLMEDRLQLSRSLLDKNGIISVAIDDEEVSVLRNLLDAIFAVQLGIVPVRSNPVGRKTSAKFAPTHEYALFYGKTENSIPGALEKTEKELARYPHEDEQGRFSWLNFTRSGTNDLRQDSPTLFYPIFISDNDEIRIPKIEYDAAAFGWIAQESPWENETAVYPKRKKDDELVDGNWQRGHERVITEPDEYRVSRNGNGISIHFKARMDEKSLPKTWWGDSRYASGKGTTSLFNILGNKDFDFPKSVALVSDCISACINGTADSTILDYFAGSGTAGHAVINLNRADNGNRKYILVELGHHFENVLLPRMKKVIYSNEWKDGKPKTRDGISQLIKYVRIESYEDTLDGLTVKSRDDMVDTAENKRLAEDYQLRYALGEQTAQSASLMGKDFTDPFNYTLSVVRDGTRRDVKVDLAETFNFLLGLRLATRRPIEDVLTITGTNSLGENCLILWRDINKINASKLDKWFSKHRKTFNNDFPHIYVNGDHTLNALKKEGEKWQAITIEPVFRELMFAQNS